MKEVSTAGKKVKGRKRHIAVDTLGNLLSVKVHAANIHDTNYGAVVLEKAKKKYQSIKALKALAAMRGIVKPLKNKR
jgi:putative transposase